MKSRRICEDFLQLSKVYIILDYTGSQHLRFTLELFVSLVFLTFDYLEHALLYNGLKSNTIYSQENTCFPLKSVWYLYFWRLGFLIAAICKTSQTNYLC